MFSPDEFVPLAPRTTLGLGGPARWLATARTEEELLAALRWASERAASAVLLGGGSNLVVADEGYPGLVIAVATRGLTWRSLGERTRVVAQAGEPWDDLVAASVAAGLGGLEAMSGIPGSVGATPIQNVGAYGQEISESLRRVRVYDRHTDEVLSWPREACDFAYRDSRFRREPGRFAVLTVELELTPAEQVAVSYPELARALGDAPATSAAVRAAVLALRRSKSMVLESGDPNRHSVGSFFVNPIVDPAIVDIVATRAMTLGVARDPAEVPRFPTADGRFKLSAAWLIQRAGFPPGTRRGAVGTSSRHSLALVHHGGGTTAELLVLAQEIRDEVSAAFGVLLHPEPSFLGVPPAVAAGLGATVV